MNQKQEAAYWDEFRKLMDEHTLDVACDPETVCRHCLFSNVGTRFEIEQDTKMSDFKKHLKEVHGIES